VSRVRLDPWGGGGGGPGASLTSHTKEAPPIYVLGLNATMHDTSAALIRDGEVIAHAEQERFDRRKHSTAFPEDAIRFCLERAGITMRDVDAAGFFWVPWRGLRSRAVQLWKLKFLKPWRRDRSGLLPQNLRVFFGMLEVPSRLRAMGFRGTFRYMDHYTCHLESIVGPSGLKDPAVLIVDGNGETLSTQWGVMEGGRYRVVGEVKYPHSLGLVYMSVTEYLGFRASNGEAKVMGLASYGTPRYVKEFEQLLLPGPAGTFEIDLSYFDYHIHRRDYVTDKFMRLFGPRRERESAILPRHEDVAASLQAVVEDQVLRITQELRRQVGRRPLVMAGGVTLNSVLNGRVRREVDFEQVWVPAWAGDQGGALGAAFALARRLEPTLDVQPMTSAALGPEYSDEQIVAALDQRMVTARKVQDAPAEAARQIAAGRVIGWFQGRSELGPRALGQRSILADPRDPEMKDRLNAKVKHREGFRPFAPAVLVEHAPEWFEIEAPSPWMLFVENVREEKRALIPAVTHVDGTARVQTVDRQQVSRFASLIDAFHALTGVPVVLNTSFNIRGEPIVETPLNAIDCFLNTGIDTLILGDHVVEKTPLTPSS